MKTHQKFLTLNKAKHVENFEQVKAMASRLENPTNNINTFLYDSSFVSQTLDKRFKTRSVIGDPSNLLS